MGLRISRRHRELEGSADLQRSSPPAHHQHAEVKRLGIRGFRLRQGYGGQAACRAEARSCGVSEGGDSGFAQGSGLEARGWFITNRWPLDM